MSLADFKTEGHLWEDISHHGSPYYECSLCGDSDDSEANWRTVCPKREEYEARLAAERERDERREWEQLVARRDREKYLNDKFGKGAS